MAPPTRSAAFQPVRRLQGLEKFPEAERSLLEQLNAIRQDLARLQARPVFTELKTGDYLAREEEYVRYAPGTGGATLMLPTPRPENKGSRVTLLLENVTLGSLTIQCVGGLVNRLTSETISSACRVDYVCDGLAGWVSEIALSILAGAGLSYAAGALAVNGSTSITVTSDEVRRAALAGEATAAANANAVTVTRSTDYNATPWTGNHKFSGEVRLGTLHSELNKSGALNITLTAGSTRVLITSSANITLGTISGAADGRVLVLEHVRASGAGDLTITHAVTTDGVACPGSVNLVLSNRGCAWLVCRDDVWRVIATTN